LLRIALGEAQAVPVKGLGIVELRRRVHGPRQPVPETGAGHLVEEVAQLLGAETPVAGVALVGQAQSVVQALVAARQATDAGVEQKGHDGALGVVADGTVGGVLDAWIKFYRRDENTPNSA